MSLREVKGIRDLLVVSLAPELAKYIADLAKAYPVEPGEQVTEAQGIERMQMLVAFVLDHITAYSFEQLAHAAAVKEANLRRNPQ
jgi:hypothetical protein